MNELVQNVAVNVLHTIEDYVEFDYSRGQHEYIIINIVELVKEELNQVVNADLVEKVKKYFLTQIVYKSTVESLDCIGSELKINLY
jgi:hypothetical protein